MRKKASNLNSIKFDDEMSMDSDDINEYNALANHEVPNTNS